MWTTLPGRSLTSSVHQSRSGYLWYSTVHHTMTTYWNGYLKLVVLKPVAYFAQLLSFFLGVEAFCGNSKNSFSQTYPRWEKTGYTQLIFRLGRLGTWENTIAGELWLWDLGDWVWNLNSQTGTPIHRQKINWMHLSFFQWDRFENG